MLGLDALPGAPRPSTVAAAATLTPARHAARDRPKTAQPRPAGVQGSAHGPRDRRSRPDGDVAGVPHRLRRAGRRPAAARRSSPKGCGCEPSAARTTNSPAPGPRGWRYCSRSAPSRARSSRSSWACCGRSSCATPAAIIGLPFSLEGFAFFIEAIFIGLYLYGWERLTPRAALAVRDSDRAQRRGLGGVRHVANAWMNMPTGFRLVSGKVVDVDPLAAMFSPPWRPKCCTPRSPPTSSTGFGAAAVCAFALLRRSAEDRREQVRAGCASRWSWRRVAIPLQFVVGDVIARFDAEHEPAKFASIEALWQTQRDAPITIGGSSATAGRATASRSPARSACWSRSIRTPR